MASSSGKRHSRGFGLPAERSIEIEPISTEPKPRPASARIADPLLSKPAASPIGLGKCRPATSVASLSSSGRLAARIAFAAQPRRAPAVIAR
jgi:hypothetical protein